MREKLATLPLSQLRELAKSQGIKYVSGLRKSELVDRLCEVAEKEKDDKTESAASGVQERTAGDRPEGNDRPARVYGERQESKGDPRSELQDLDSGIEAYGILEVMPDGFGFIRCENFLPGENDVYVAPSRSGVLI